MVGSGILYFSQNAHRLEQICYVSAGVFISGVFYATTIHKLFPKSKFGDRVADILEQSVDNRQVALLHHIEHEHQGDLQAIRNLRMKVLETKSVPEGDILDMPTMKVGNVVNK
jgi:hypothetical protein